MLNKFEQIYLAIRKKMKKILTVLAISIFAFILIGCGTTTTKTYQITYCVDGEVIKLDPSTYEEGKELTLPTPLIEPGSGEVFDGWYTNKNYTGEKITKIDENSHSDLTYYGKIIQSKETYNITYYVDGIAVSLMPETYQKGDSFVLPEPLVELNDAFDGWYFNSNYTGEKVTKVNEALIGDIALYGRVLHDIDPMIALDAALAKDNYTYTIKTSDGLQTSISTYLFDKGNIKYQDSEDESYDMYLVTVGNEKRFIYCDNNQWYYISETDENFMYYEMAFQMIELMDTSRSAFTYNESKKCYVVQSSKLQQLAQTFLGYYEGEVFESFELYIEKNIVSKILITSTYSYDGEATPYEYEITFSNYGQTQFTIPNATDYNEGLATTISDVYTLADGTTNVVVTGIITGIYGNNFYLADEEKGILVYCGSNSEYVNTFSLGDTVTVTGNVQIYKNVHQLSSILDVVASSKKVTPPSISLNNVEQNTLSEYVNDRVSVEGVTIQTLPKSYPTTGSDVSFTVELNGAMATVFISKHLDSTSKNTLFDYLKQKSVGDTIDLNDVHISKYNEYQLALTNASVLEDGYQTGAPVKLVRIETSPDQLVVEQGITLEEVLTSISVFKVYNDKTKVLLDSFEYQVDHRFVANMSGDFTFTFTYEGFTAKCVVAVMQVTDSFYPEIAKQPLYEVLSQMGYDEETGETYGINKGLPSIGSPKVLVIPIAFTDCPAPSKMVSDLEKTFFGTSVETGWESLNSYYQKSSYGKLNIQGTVLEPFNTGHTVSYYNNLQTKYNQALEDYYNYKTDVYPDNVEFSIIKEALAYYDATINYDDYDTDKDGYIDSIYLVYTTDYNATDDTSLWWAFTTEYVTEDFEYYDGVEADYYTFFSYQFIFDKLQEKTVQYNAETIIHETGHLLGLTDYYDYDETVGPSGGIGGGDMMDYNVGDHNAYSKLLLGWVTPLVVSGKTTTIELESFEKSGDCVFIFNSWNQTFFDEYYVIDFYTPTGLNAFSKGYNGLFTTSGVRIYHVDATLNDPANCFSIFDVTKYNNTDSTHRLISLVEADGRSDIDYNGSSEDSDLFQAGDTLTNVNWYTGEKAKFSIHVVSIDETKATITITY